MATFINKQTGKPENLPDSDIHDALLSGTHTLGAGEVEVDNPDGERGTIPADKAMEAIQSGYRIIGPQEKAINEYVDQNKGLKGTLKVGLTQMADEAAFGVPETVWEHTADPLERAKWQALKKDHDLANTLGAGAGFGANLLVGGPLFKGATKAAEVAAKGAESVAAKLAEKAGFELGKGQASRIAKNIVSKAISGGVEGALFSAPHAVTEAALGDPELGGESILFGGGLGAIFGAGGGLAGELMGISKKAAKEAYTFLEGKAPTIENVKGKLGKILTGVPEEDIEYYLQNKERINANSGRQIFDVMDDIDTAARRYRSEAESAAERARAAKDELQYHYRTELENLKQERPTMQLGQEIVDDLGAAGKTLGEQSERADEVLANAYEKKGKTQVPVQFSRSDVLGRITKEIKGLGAIVGEQKLATKSYLEGLQGQIRESFGDKISGPDMRELMRTLRKENESFWSREPGQINSYAEKSLASLSEGMSDLIKRKVPIYGDIMSEMSPLAKSLREMQQRFGTVDKAMNALRGVTGEKGEILEGALKRYGDLREKDFVTKLGTYKRAKDLLRQSKLDDLSAVLLPEMTRNVNNLRAEASTFASRNSGFDRLGEARTQAVIGNMKRKLPNEKDRRALEYLSQLEGHTPGSNDFLTQIKDRHVLDSFDVERTNGSRRVNLLGSLGAALGGAAGTIAGGGAAGAMGAAAGATAGATLDVYGGRILKKLLDGETFLGPLFVESRFAAAGRALDRIPDILKEMSENRALKRMPAPTAAGRYGIIKMLTGEELEDSRHGHKDGVVKFTERLAELTSNPDLLSSQIAGIIGPIRKHGAPVIGGIAAQKMATAINYLYAEAPKSPRPPTPFSAPVHWKPNDYDTKKFLDKVEIVNDPFKVIDHLQNGSLSRSHMQALKTVYPALYEQIKTRVYRAVATEKAPLNYNDRVKMSLLLDTPLDVNMTPERILKLQQTFLNPADQPKDASAAPMTGGVTGTPINIKSSASKNTASDINRRLMGG